MQQQFAYQLKGDFRTAATIPAHTNPDSLRRRATLLVPVIAIGAYCSKVGRVRQISMHAARRHRNSSFVPIYADCH